jgi:hypothetical protein
VDKQKAFELVAPGLNVGADGVANWSGRALVVEGGRLYSGSEDGTIRVWEAGTWAAVRSVAAYDAEGSRQHPCCLVTSNPCLAPAPPRRPGVGHRRC